MASIAAAGRISVSTNLPDLGGSVHGARAREATLVAKAIPGSPRFLLPSAGEQMRLAKTGKFLQLRWSTSGSLQKNDPRSFVGDIKYIKKLRFNFEVANLKSCQKADDHYTKKVEGREAGLYKFVDASGSLGYMIGSGKNYVVLTGVSTPEGAGDILPGKPIRPESSESSDGFRPRVGGPIDDAILNASYKVANSVENLVFYCTR